MPAQNREECGGDESRFVHNRQRANLWHLHSINLERLKGSVFYMESNKLTHSANTGGLAPPGQVLGALREAR